MTGKINETASVKNHKIARIAIGHFAAKHPVELFQHVTHKIDNTSSLSRPKEATIDATFWQLSFLSGRVSVRSTFQRYAMATPAFLCTACPLNSCSAICLALGSGGRRSIRGTMCSSPSTASSRIGWITVCSYCSSWVCTICTSWILLDPPGFSELSSLAGSDPAGSSPRTQTVASHQFRCISASCRYCTRHFLCTQPCNRGIANSRLRPLGSQD